MNRADRRRQQRKNEKNQTVVTEDNLRNLFSKFNDRDFKLIDGIIENRVSNILEESSYILDMVYSAKLSDLGFSWEEAEKFNNEVTKMFKEDRERLKKITEEWGKDCDVKMAKMAEEVENRIKELVNTGAAKKEVIETILFEFPKLTKSMATNAYSRVNADLKKEHEKEKQVDEDPIIKDAIDYIFEEEKSMEKDKVAEKIENKDTKETVNPVVVTEATVEQANLNPPVITENATAETKGFKILEESVVKTFKLEGENGTYYAKTGEGVRLTKDGGTICFGNIEQLENWVKEYKKVFALI